MSGQEIREAAELLERLVPNATPGPWRDSSVDGNRYHALVSDTCIRNCDAYVAARRGTSSEFLGHPHDGYGGCLIAESQTAQDRRLMAVMREVADDLAAMLRAVADEDPIEVGRIARSMSESIRSTHRLIDVSSHSTVTRSADNGSPTDDAFGCG